MPYDKLILSHLRSGRFAGIRFKPYQRMKFLREVEEEFIPILLEMSKADYDTTDEWDEVLRELIKDWIGDNYSDLIFKK
jgi:hypothetical protein